MASWSSAAGEAGVAHFVCSVATAERHLGEPHSVHKSQGAEFEHTVLVLSSAGQRASRELVYTGITRAREVFSLVLQSRMPWWARLLGKRAVAADWPG